MPTAFDEAGLRMLDSIREIFDILELEFESVGFDFVEYTNFEELDHALRNGKCPVVDVLRKYLYSIDEDGAHVMVATGIKDRNGVKNIQLKNSYAENPNEQGKVLYFTFAVIVSIISFVLGTFLRCYILAI